jgi:hypothetical protein
MAHREMLAQGASLPVLVDTYRTITQSGVSPANQTTRFSVSSGSVNWVIGSLLPNFTANDTGPMDGDDTSSDLFQRDGSAASRWYIRINNVNHPAYSADSSDAWIEMLKLTNSLNDTLGGTNPEISTATAFLNSYWACGTSLSMPNTGSDRFLTGLDSQGSALDIQFTVEGTSSSSDPTTAMIVAGITSRLNIYAGRQLELID